MATEDSSDFPMNSAPIMVAVVLKDNLEFFQVIKIIHNSTIFPNIDGKLDWILILSTFLGSSTSSNCSPAVAPGQKAASYTVLAKPARHYSSLGGAGQNLAVADFHIDFSPIFAYRPAINLNVKYVTILMLYNIYYLQNQ